MTELIIFPDAQRAVRDFLRAALPARTEPYAIGATVSTRDPDKAPSSARPFVKVALIGSSRSARLDGQAQLRVTVWHRDEGLALELAALIEGLLLVASSSTIRGCSSDLGPAPAPDPDTGEAMASITITARLHPRQLS